MSFFQGAAHADSSGKGVTASAKELRDFADIGTGLTAEPASTERVVTIGANLNFGQGLVFKMDVQRFKQNKDDNRFDMGLGWSF